MRLEGLNPVEYEHPEDTAGLEALENIPGVRDIALKIWETWLDKQLLFESTASYVEIKDSNSKRLYGLFRTACEVLDFINIMPGTPKAKVKSRIILTPEHTKKFLKALSDNLDKYETNHGPVKEFKKEFIPLNFGPKGEA